MKTLEVLLGDLKGIVLSSFKVTIRNHSHIIRTDRFEVATTRYYITDDLNLQGGLEVTNWRICVSKPLNGISKS